MTRTDRSDMSDSFDDCDREMQRRLEFFGFLTAEQLQCFPDWVVMAPPKTGTSWLAENLRMHPQVFVPWIKEVKYFSNRFETEDLRWYLSHFRGGIGKSKGEAPPSYSLLPRSTIQVIRRLIPNLKLIFLMRDPIDRAWSHARHNFRYREANFKGRQNTIDEISENDWIANVNDDWNRLCGDYLGQLKRWLSVFPREQIYLGYFEDLVAAPRPFLRSVLNFLDVDPDFADSQRVTIEPVNAGLSKAISRRVEQHLAELYQKRTIELAAFLDREFNMTVPREWHRTIAPSIADGISNMTLPPNAEPTESQQNDCDSAEWDVDDQTLSRLLGRDDLLEMDFLGFRIVRRGKEYLAYRLLLGNLNPENYSRQWWEEQVLAGNSFFAGNPYDLKTLIVHQVIKRDMPPGSDQSRLHQVELQLDRVMRQEAVLLEMLREYSKQLDDARAEIQKLSRQHTTAESVAA